MVKQTVSKQTTWNRPGEFNIHDAVRQDLFKGMIGRNNEAKITVGLRVEERTEHEIQTLQFYKIPQAVYIGVNYSVD